MKNGIAVHFPVSMRSIFSLLLLSLLFTGFLTHAEQTFIMNEKRMSAIAALLSRPRSFSI